MDSVEEYLVHRGDGLVLLFTPPFDDWEVDPGYIKGYLPGVRENGGQYTHAAIWCVIAFATLGDGDRAGELFSLLNPINHASTRAGIHRYRVEPYVASADVYSKAPHVGAGRLTWYTGSAGWMYRAGGVDPRLPPPRSRASRRSMHTAPGEASRSIFATTSPAMRSRSAIPTGSPGGVTSLTLDAPPWTPARS